MRLRVGSGCSKLTARFVALTTYRCGVRLRGPSLYTVSPRKKEGILTCRNTAQPPATLLSPNRYPLHRSKFGTTRHAVGFGNSRPRKPRHTYRWPSPHLNASPQPETVVDQTGRVQLTRQASWSLAITSERFACPKSDATQLSVR